MNEYPTDELGVEINDGITFGDLYRSLNNYHDVYSFLGVGDSIVRERCFERLSEVLNVDYDVIYKQWLKGADYR